MRRRIRAPRIKRTFQNCRVGKAGLIDLPGVLGLLVDLEPDQARLLDRICSGPLVPIAELHEQSALETPPKRPRKPASGGHGELFGGE